jgi:hypothetical protein
MTNRMKLYDDSPKKDEPELPGEPKQQEPKSTQDDRMFDPSWMWT